ncbi:TonB-dependent siderophore receptor [Methylomonas sp. BW4-1]|uniref:TonB-dependent siderophore receptor n=1 Tax=Methylomonas sp. BW4-1 TaxID=3376685 RepID=UPI004042F902
MKKSLDTGSVHPGQARMFKPKPIAALFLLGTVSLAAMAGDAAQAFNIPAQALDSALTELAYQTNLRLLYPADLVGKRRSSQVSGQYTPEQAMQRMLQDSGLTVRKTADDTFTLEPAANAEPRAATTMPAVTVMGRAVYDSTDPYNADYSLPNASTATKTDTPIMETPFSVQVVPKQVLEDTQAVRPGDALNYVSGIYQGTANSGDWLDWSRRRGFDNYPAGDYRNGAPFPLGGAWGGRDLANVERVEALKGPASLLYGLTAPGGVVNYVTKQPLATPYYSLQQQFGSYDFYRTTVDATGPITDDKSLLYRINLAYKDANSFRGMVSSDRIFIAPTVTWNISPKTQVNFELEYDYGHVVFDRGIPAIGNRPADVPRSRFLGEADPRSTFERVLVGMNWSHAFNDNWTLSHRFTAVYNGIETYAANPTGLNTDNRMLNIFGVVGHRPPEDDASYFNAINLTGHFDTWGLQHTLLLGGDYFRTFRQGTEQYYFNAVDIYNPTYLGANAIQNQIANAPVVNSSALEQWFGLYLQDQIKLPFNFSMLAGFRYDGAENEYVDLVSGTVTENPMQDSLTPRGGLIWQPIPEFSVYGSYTENFVGVQSGRSIGGSLLSPETAQQWEFGAKTELFDKKLMATLAWFDLTKQNMAIYQPPTFIDARAIGEAKTADVKGEILPGWNIIGAYAYTPDAKVIKGYPGENGQRLPGVPKHGGSLFTTYELQAGTLRGLKFGGGVLVRGSQTTETSNTDVVLPGYATVNLLTSYSWKVGGSKLTTQLNVNNLLDKEYFPSAAFSRNAIEVGTPRTFMGSVRVEY